MWDVSNKGICIHFYWIKAHIGIRGNKIVGNLVKQATMHGEVSNLGAIYLPYDLYKHFKSTTSAQWQKWYGCYPGGNAYGSIFPYVQLCTWFSHGNKREKILLTISINHSGHCASRSHLSHLGLEWSNVCEACTEENLQYIMCCQCFRRKEQIYLHS